MSFRMDKWVCSTLFLLILASTVGSARAEGTINGEGRVSIEVKPTEVQVFLP